MKKLTKYLVVFLIFTLLFLSSLIYISHYANYIPDDLGGFVIAIFCGGAFVISTIFLISTGFIILFQNTSSILRFIGATLFSTLIVYIVLGLTILPDIIFW